VKVHGVLKGISGYYDSLIVFEGENADGSIAVSVKNEGEGFHITK